MKEVIERCNWLVNKCEDKAITPDVKDDVRCLLEEIERLNNIIDKAIEYIEENRTIVDERDSDLLYWLNDDFDEQKIINILKGDTNV